MLLEVNVTERLLDRLRNSAAVEGMTQDGYIERAILNAIIESERRASRRERIYRDADEFPYKCDYCAERFKLPMHRGNHIRHTHPEYVEDVEPQVTIDPKLRESIAETVAVQAVDQPPLKLADGMAELMETFEEKLARYQDDVPRLD